jgi:hypothetical protein
MVKRFLLDWIDAKARGPSIGGQNDLVVVASTHEAKAALAFPQLAKAWAKITLNAPILAATPISGQRSFWRPSRSYRFCYVHND